MESKRWILGSLTSNRVKVLPSVPINSLCMILWSSRLCENTFGISEQFAETFIYYFFGWWLPLEAATASNAVFSMRSTMLLCTKCTNITIFHAENIVSSACRYRIIRALRAIKVLLIIVSSACRYRTILSLAKPLWAQRINSRLYNKLALFLLN